MKPSGPSWRLTVIVVLSATDWERTRPCLCRLFGTQPTPSASAAGTSPEGSGRPLIPIVAAGEGTEPGHRLGDADAAAAGRAGEADDLAAAHREADIVEILAAQMARRRARRRRRSGAVAAAGVGDTEMDLLAGHRLDQPSFGRSATGAVMMWRASRSTVTAWQIS